MSYYEAEQFDLPLEDNKKAVEKPRLCPLCKKLPSVTDYCPYARDVNGEDVNATQNVRRKYQWWIRPVSYREGAVQSRNDAPSLVAKLADRMATYAATPGPILASDMTLRDWFAGQVLAARRRLNQPKNWKYIATT
jgi:hypothetical protein